MLLSRIPILLALGVAVPVHADTSRPVTLTIRDVAISVEVADTPAARARGLMYRKQLARDSGMLFIFPDVGYHAMWMAHTYLALSVAFLDAAGRIVDIQDLAPLTTTAHGPPTPAKFALEMNRGWFGAHRIHVGERVLGLPAAGGVDR